MKVFQQIFLLELFNKKLSSGCFIPWGVIFLNRYFQAIKYYANDDLLGYLFFWLSVTNEGKYENLAWFYLYFAKIASF